MHQTLRLRSLEWPVVRRTIPEIVAKYRLNRGVRDVYVEGPFDRNILRWFFDASHVKGVAVLQIELIDVPSEILVKYQLSDGARSRVIALGRELASVFGANLAQARFVVDADCDRLLAKTVDSEHVFVTDYTCMEMYLVRDSLLAKYLHAVLGCDGVDIRELLQQYSDILGELFLIRAANEALSAALRWVSFERCCELRGDTLLFNRADFLSRLLNASSSTHLTAVLIAKIEELRALMDPDIRHHAQGHDFVSLLAFHFSREAKRCGLPNAEAVSSVLRGCLEIADVDHEALFVALKAVR